ncbi:MAG TPA: AAA family ATPase [Gaiellaceae bacterium]|nr:AAA family ATPase [Gaiellaceae bacterium]
MAQPGVSTEAAAPLPPQNLDAEETILGALMLAGAGPIIDDVVETGLRPEDFYSHRNGHIYRACQQLRERGEPIDLITVVDHLERAQLLDQAGGAERVRELAAIVPAASNAVHFARIVRDMARLRALISVGNEIARLGYDRPGEVPELLAKAAELVATVHGDDDAHARLRVETWREFEQASHDRIATLVDGLWPEAALGFIAAPPKKGKTWLGLDLGISVAAGQPFLNHFAVPAPQPVVYLALEGHRAAIRARIGALARGHGIDPDHPDQLGNLNVVYKPRGLNLADPAWIRDVRAAIREHGAKLLIVDVLRAAAAFKENDNDAFNAFRLILDPIVQDGCSIALLHHFGKLTEISRDRTPGERMSGAGAMYGAFDVGIFITATDKETRELRLEFELRDLATPDPLGFKLAGDGTGENGGFVYADSARWEEVSPPEDDDLGGWAQDVYDLVHSNGGAMSVSQILLALEADGEGITDRTLRRRRSKLEAAGLRVEYRGARRETHYVIPTEPGTPDNPGHQLNLMDGISENPGHDPRADMSGMSGSDQMSGLEPHNHAGLPECPDIPDTTPMSDQDLAQPCAIATPDIPDSPKGELSTLPGAAPQGAQPDDTDHDAEWLS